MNKREEAIRKQARRDFLHHIATIRVNTDDILVIDWRNSNGSSNYYVQYIIDKKRGMLAISGDLGDSISCWYHEISFDDILTFTKDVSYWMGKFQATSDDYTCRQKDIKSDLKKILNDYLKNKEDYTFCDKSDDEIREDFKEISDELDYNWDGKGAYPQDAIEIIEKYDCDWWESEWSRLGKRVSTSVYLWAEGFKMAYEQIMEMNAAEKDVFEVLVNSEISTYTSSYAPARGVVTTKQIVANTIFTANKVKSILKSLIFKGYVEYTSLPRPAIESNTENGCELVCEAMPPLNGYAITDKGAKTQMFIDAEKKFDESMKKWTEEI